MKKLSTNDQKWLCHRLFKQVLKENDDVDEKHAFVQESAFYSFPSYFHSTPSPKTATEVQPEWLASIRLGKGSLTGPVAYSPDGARLAVASSLGIWLYDTDDIFKRVPCSYETHGLDRQYGIQSEWLDACDWEWLEWQNHPSVGCDNW